MQAAPHPSLYLTLYIAQRSVATITRPQKVAVTMDEQSENNEENPAQTTCAECVHTFRSKDDHNVVICVPHIKTMPADYCDVCPLHRRKEKES